MKLSYIRCIRKLLMTLSLIMLFWCLINYDDTLHINPHIVYLNDPWDDLMDFKLLRFEKLEPLTKPKIHDDDPTFTWSADELEDLVEHPTETCKKLIAVGGTWHCSHCHNCARDGHKYVCMDPDVAPEPGQCIVYSFGVGEELTFDYQIAKYKCTVYGFDMTLINKTSRVLAPRLHLMLLGLDISDFEARYSMHDEQTPDIYTRVNASFRKFETIRRILDHEHRAIDYLKMDIESSEWKVFQQIFKNPESAKVMDNIKQLALEIHFDDFKNASHLERVEGGMKYLEVLSTLKAHGFHLVHTELNKFHQEFAEVRGKIFPLFRESLFIRRPPR